MQDLRTLFEGKYPGKERLFEALIKPIFSKATDTSLTDEQVLVDSDRGQIKSCSIIAQVRGGFPIIFADVELQDTVDLKRSRVNIQNCVRRIMENNTNAIIFFHFTDTAKEWRVSYVHRAGTNRNSTSAKRHTYLCGPEHSCRTVSERFETLKGLATIKDEDMAEAFSVEPLSKEFFDAYKTFYEDFVQYITGSRYVKVGGKYERKVIGKENSEIFGQFKEHASGDYDLACKLVRDYVKKLMGRLVFLHFLQKKGWLGVGEGKPWGSGDRNFIQNLFAKADDGVKDDFLSRALEPLFFRTLNTDRGKAALAPEEISAVYGRSVRIPYLNGGLFEEDELDKKRVRFKKEHFSDLLDFFSRYNFTIDEGDPTDKEIGIDPEMLGKIFENLLEDNKDKGAFYTPKEIVQYMCRESLAAYLCADGSADAGAVRRILERGDAEDMGEDEKSALLERLRAVKVCDPAVGSGAFPMGMMNELLALRAALGDTEEPSEIKKQIVRDNIYGVDIEKGAVDIARLRFWLAIIVDEQEPIPLPNLDYKIMRGNSLLESYTYKNVNDKNRECTVDLSQMLKKPEDGGLDYTEEQRNLLETSMDAYFDPDSHDNKRAKNDVIKACVFDLACATCGLKPNSEPALALHEKIWNGTDDFFLWHTWFGDVFNGRGGFDIVIGNPPYVEAKKLKHIASVLKNWYEVYSGTADLSIYFTEQGMNLLKENGILSLITTNKFFNTEYGKPVRSFIAKKHIMQLINFEQVEVFENVLVSSVILILQNKDSVENSDLVYERFYKLKADEFKSAFVEKQGAFGSYGQKFLTDSEWSFSSSEKLQLKAKIENGTVRIKDLNGVYVYRGVTTGYNPAFIISDAQRDSFIKADSKNATVIKNMLQGRNIRKWYYNESDENLIFTRRGIDIKKYPMLEKHLKQFYEKLKPKNNQTDLEGRKPGAYKWFEILDNTAYYSHFEKSEKIIWGLTADKWAFALDTERHYLPSNGYIMTSDTMPIRFLLGLLNSKLLHYYFGYIGIMTAGGAYTLKAATIEALPIPVATSAQQKPVIALVDKILAAKKQDPAANTSELEAQIDGLVYALYGLTSEEIAVVEGR